MEKIKRLCISFMSAILSFAMIFTTTPLHAAEIKEVDDELVFVDNYNETLNHPYAIDVNGNLITDSNMEIASVEVVYDGAWYGMRTANVPKIINVSVVCKGTGELAHSMYNCKLNVALEFKYNSSTMKITSVGKPDVYNYTAPGALQNASNPRATAAITNSGKSVTITGYIDYKASIYQQTFTGKTTYYL